MYFPHSLALWPLTAVLPAIVSRASSIWRVRYIAVLSPQPLTAAARFVGARHWTWDIGPPPQPPSCPYLLGLSLDRRYGARMGAQLKCAVEPGRGRGRSVHLVATASELEQKKARGEGKINKYRFGQRLWAAPLGSAFGQPPPPPPPNCVKDHRYDFSPNTALVESRIIGNKR